jgi:hypothetical protein
VAAAFAGAAFAGAALVAAVFAGAAFVAAVFAVVAAGADFAGVVFAGAAFAGALAAGAAVFVVALVDFDGTNEPLVYGHTRTSDCLGVRGEAVRKGLTEHHCHTALGVPPTWAVREATGVATRGADRLGAGCVRACPARRRDPLGVVRNAPGSTP